MKKVALGLSGGVDSAVSARLLQEDGWTVSGLYMDLGSAQARADAVEAAASLGIPLEIVDIREALEKAVCAPFAGSYLRGETPNPCVLCNPAVKLRLLCEHADAIGAEAIATGHYARTADGGLYRALSPKDQSYMLCRILPEQLSRLLLPLGELDKPRVRALAAQFGLAAAGKPDSMEICFIPDNDYARWLSARGAVPGEGVFVREGKVLGSHGGVHRWTVGQRIPGVYDGEKLYVRRIDAATGSIEVCPDSALWRSRFTARDFRWLDGVPSGPVRGSVKVRHTRTGEAPCTACPRPDGGVDFVCERNVRAPAPGQTAALYQGDRVLGGGFIVPD